MRQVRQVHQRCPALSGAPAGNERLTAMTGAVLLILLAVEGYPILRIGRLRRCCGWWRRSS
jgi:hypothetical protein